MIATSTPTGIAVNHGHVAELLPMVRALADCPNPWAGMMPFSLDGRPMFGPGPWPRRPLPGWRSGIGAGSAADQ